MSNKRLLTLDDLYSFYVKQGKNVAFNADSEQTNLIVQVPGRAVFKKKQDDDKEGLLAVHLQANHTQTNLNKSHIEDDVCLNALPSFKNRPILGYLHQVDGEWNFWGHNMHEDDEGNIEYDEIPIGIIPESCNAELKYDEEKKKNYVEVDGYIFEEYSHAAEVLQRENQCDVSVELSIRELSYNAKEKYLDIKNYFYSGVTVLGCDDEGQKIEPGMAGSNIKLADFSLENNSNLNDINEKLDNFFEKISGLFNNIDSTKGGNSQMTKFEELLAKYNVTAEEIEFEHEGLTDEELEAKFAEVFGESTEEESEVPEVSENESEEGAEVVDEPETTEKESNESETAEEEPNESEECELDSIASLEEEKLFTKTFSISHEDVKSALYTLLASYEEADNDWYYIESVYDDHFAYSGMFSGSIYGQAYTKDGDEVAFDGERYALHRELLTDSEYAQLNDMRADYAYIKEQLSEYQKKEETSNKKALVASEEYSSVAENEEFVKLVNSVNEEKDNLTFEELKATADKIQLEAAKSNSLKFAVESPAKVKTTKVALPVVEDKTECRYGNLFDR